ncbi:MAG: hypothetical protein BAJATHORv1_60005 [Candidatus Thorarchaeota archaeon]|nr:MAG: hypothetical protein BAJATHORv1_60005 [Candidatus Thorarchaeota archaeon]
MAPTKTNIPHYFYIEDEDFRADRICKVFLKTGFEVDSQTISQSILRKNNIQAILVEHDSNNSTFVCGMLFRIGNPRFYDMLTNIMMVCFIGIILTMFLFLGSAIFGLIIAFLGNMEIVSIIDMYLPFLPLLFLVFCIIVLLDYGYSDIYISSNTKDMLQEPISLMVSEMNKSETIESIHVATPLDNVIDFQNPEFISREIKLKLTKCFVESGIIPALSDMFWRVNIEK